VGGVEVLETAVSSIVSAADVVRPSGMVFLDRNACVLKMAEVYDRKVLLV
jgi:hypothetical protein